MPWRNYSGLSFALQPPAQPKRRYSVTADVLSFQQCSSQYEMFRIRKYEPALVLQLFFGTVIHQVLDKAHNHYRGRVGSNPSGSFPTDSDIENYFDQVENALKARHVSATPKVKQQALELLKRFNSLEGPTLYPRIVDTECKLQADQGSYILHGNVDVLATVNGQPSNVEIWDYKGTERPSQGDPAYQQYTFQMLVYAELYKRRTGVMPQKALLYFLDALSGPTAPHRRPVNAIMEVKIDQTAVNSAMANFSQTVQIIENCRATGVWPGPTTTPSIKTCNACDKRWNCSSAASFGRCYSLIYP